MLKKGIALLLALVMVFSCGMVANAQTEEMVAESMILPPTETPIMPQSEYLPQKNVELTISSNSTATCSAYVEGKKTSVYRVDITMTLQKKTLLWWSDVETWSSTTYDYKASMTQTASVGSGTYRVKLVATVHYSAEEESTTIYSTNASA